MTIAAEHIQFPQSRFIDDEGYVSLEWQQWLLNPQFLTINFAVAVDVPSGGTGLSTGISGGILGFTGPTTIASSALLAQHELVIGGGAGATPATTVGLGTTTTVLHGNASGDPTWGPVTSADAPTMATIAYVDAKALATFTNSLGADVLLNNIANYFDGPSVPQGTLGTWFASGTITLVDTAGISQFDVKLWDGTTVMASVAIVNPLAGAGNPTSVTLSGTITNPAGNIRISARDQSLTTGKILFNASGNSKDATVTAIQLAP